MPLGTWHYSTILCQLVHWQIHAKVLETELLQARENTTTSLLREGDQQ